MKTNMRLYKKILIAIPAVLVLFVALFLTLLSWGNILTKSLNRYVPAAINASFHTAKADFTFIGSFPNI